MEHINFLRQASLADKIGNYKLADNLFQRALRLAAGGVSIFERELMKLLEKLVLTAEEKGALKIGEESLVKAWGKGGSTALKTILEKRGLAALADEAATKEFLRSVGIIEEEALTKAALELKGATADGQKEILRRIIGEEIVRIEREIPAKTIIQNIFNKETFETAFKALGPGFKKYFIDNPNGFGKFAAWATSAGIVYDIGARGMQFYNKVTGKPISQVAILDMITKVPGLFGSGGPESTPPGSTSPSGTAGSGSGAAGEAGSGAGGAAGTPDPTTAPGFQYQSKEDMYQRRMKAKMPGGKFQQTLKGDAVQKFVDDNKGKYTTQRAFYNAAEAAVDENFANSVIALVKKDLNLDVDTNDPRKF